MTSRETITVSTLLAISLALATDRVRAQSIASSSPLEQLRYRPASTPDATFVTVPNITDAVDVAVGDGHACALSRDGSVHCWGRNREGQLGDGTTLDRTLPVLVTGVRDAVQIAAGEAHTCARLRDGSVTCWGSNAYRQIANARSRLPFERPTVVPGLAGVVDLASSGNRICVVLADGTARCSGHNAGGSLGDGTREDAAGFVPVQGLVDAVQITTGSAFTCARSRARTLTCWGANDRGQLGIGADVEQITAAQAIALRNVTAMAAGDSIACAVADRRVQCWGEVGRDGTHGFTAAPVVIRDASRRPLVDVVALAAQRGRMCFVRRTGRLACFDVVVGSATPPVARVVPGINGVVRAAVRPPVQCIVARDGGMRCAGPAREEIPLPTPAPRPPR